MMKLNGQNEESVKSGKNVKKHQNRAEMFKNFAFHRTFRHNVKNAVDEDDLLKMELQIST